MGRFKDIAQLVIGALITPAINPGTELRKKRLGKKGTVTFRHTEFKMLAVYQVKSDR